MATEIQSPATPSSWSKRRECFSLLVITADAKLLLHRLELLRWKRSRFQTLVVTNPLSSLMRSRQPNRLEMYISFLRIRFPHLTHRLDRRRIYHS